VHQAILTRFEWQFPAISIAFCAVSLYDVAKAHFVRFFTLSQGEEPEKV
jgi:hypothetical protein